MQAGAPRGEPANKLAVAALCLLAGVLPFVARWLGNEPLSLAYGLTIAAILGASALYLRRRPRLRPLAPLFLAFFVLAVVQVLNNSIPRLILTHLLHETATAEKSLGSSLRGSIVIQLSETAIALVPIFLLTLASRERPGEIYVQKGRVGFWLGAVIVFFAVLYVVTFRITTRHMFAVHGEMTLHRYLGLTPALLLMALSNGLQEELLFRALFLRKLIALIGFPLANVVQAMIFTVAHAGIGYTPNVILFLAVFVFPLGLFCGYLMRRTDSVLAPVIFHAGADLPIYLSFLSFAT